MLNGSIKTDDEQLCSRAKKTKKKLHKPKKKTRKKHEPHDVTSLKVGHHLNFKKQKNAIVTPVTL